MIEIRLKQIDTVMGFSLICKGDVKQKSTFKNCETSFHYRSKIQFQTISLKRDKFQKLVSETLLSVNVILMRGAKEVTERINFKKFCNSCDFSQRFTLLLMVFFFFGTDNKLSSFVNPRKTSRKWLQVNWTQC